MKSNELRANRLVMLCAAVAMSSGGSAALAADVVIGVPNWPSVQATAHVLKVALEDKLGVEVELKEGSNTDVFKAMDAGTMHVHPEAWLPNIDHLKREFVDGKKTVKMHHNGAVGTQGMCTTKGTVERTGIAELKDLSKPDMARNFDTNGDGRGEVWIGADGWGSTPIEEVRARSYGYDKTMTLRKMEEAPAHEEINVAIKDDKNIVFFCYSPHHIFTAHELVLLKEPEHDPSQWIIVPPGPTPGWFEKSTAGVAWDDATLNVSYATSLEQDQPEVAAALAKVKLDTDMLSAMTYALAVEKQDPSEFAKKWVADNASTVDAWFN